MKATMIVLVMYTNYGGGEELGRFNVMEDCRSALRSTQSAVEQQQDTYQLATHYVCVPKYWRVDQ